MKQLESKLAMDYFEAKRKKERSMSNAEFLNYYYPELVKSKTIVIVNIDENDIISTYQISDSQIRSLGMIEIAKKQILEDMENE